MYISVIIKFGGACMYMYSALCVCMKSSPLLYTPSLSFIYVPSPNVPSPSLPSVLMSFEVAHYFASLLHNQSSIQCAFTLTVALLPLVCTIIVHLQIQHCTLEMGVDVIRGLYNLQAAWHCQGVFRMYAGAHHSTWQCINIPISFGYDHTHNWAVNWLMILSFFGKTHLIWMLDIHMNGS